MVQILTDVGNGAAREGGEVPDKLILGSNRWNFQNVAVRYPRHNSDHFVVMGCLRGASLREHLRYLGRRTCLPL